MENNRGNTRAAESAGRKHASATASTAAVIVSLLVAVVIAGTTSAAAAAAGRKAIAAKAGAGRAVASDAKTSGKRKKSKRTRIAKGPRKPAATTPGDFIAARTTKLLSDLKGRPVQATAPGAAVAVDLPMAANKQQWLTAVYNQRLVDASYSTGLLADKRLFYEVVKRELGSKADTYWPKTIGLREFLVSRQLVDANGRLTSDGDRLEAELHQQFRSGFVVRPAVGVAPRETGHGIFPDADVFIGELLKPDSILYRPEYQAQPVRSTVLDTIASGESVVLQEDVMASAHARSPLKSRAWRDVRVHTYEGRVVADATPNFWVREGSVTVSERERAESFVREFLALLSAPLVARQAWSFDVLLLDNGEMRIVDLITNRGRRTAWSTYLDQPRVLGAYTRHFEQYAGIHFAGLGGFWLRHNAGNYFSYWGLRIEHAKPGLDAVLAWIPPWP